MAAVDPPDPPIVFPQLQTRPGAGDCGPSCVGEALYIASGGRWKFNRWTTTVAYGRDNRIALVERLRSIGGAPRTGASDNDEMQPAYMSTFTANQFAAKGLRPPRASRVYSRADFDTEFPKPQLQAGKWVSLSVKYTTIDQWNDGAVSGQPGYTGGHQIVVGNYRTVGSGQWVTMVDPLADGRRSDVASGPQAIPLSVIKDAADGYTGDGSVGTASGFAFWTVALIDEPDPGPGTTTVPNLVNVVEATALTSLTTAELTPGNREEDYHASIVAGRVISTDPVAATSVVKLTTVDYVVSLGPEPAAPATDPDPPSPCDDPSGYGCG